MTVLITGGHGHIGSWTGYYLAKAGEDVILLDIDPAPLDYLADVAHKITSIQCDVMDLVQLQAVVASQAKEVSGIVHTVGIMGPFVTEEPYRNVHINVVGTLNVLELARTLVIPKVVYTSTGAIYKPTAGVVTEDAEIRPSDLYGSTKLASETIGAQYAETFGFEFRISRVYFVYGPGKLPSAFIRLYQMAFGVLEGMGDLVMDKGETQRLDFTYVKDAARGTALLYQAEGLKHTTYNIATGQSTSVGEVIEIAKQYSHYAVKVTIGPGDLMNRAEALDITRAQTDLGYHPQYTLEEGIKEYADWIKNTKEGGEK